MTVFATYVLIAVVCTSLAAVLFYFVSAPAVQNVATRLKISIYTFFISVGYALLFPVSIAIIGGRTMLPPLLGWLVTGLALMCLPAIWKSLLGRLTKTSTTVENTLAEFENAEILREFSDYEGGLKNGCSGEAQAPEFSSTDRIEQECKGDNNQAVITPFSFETRYLASGMPLAQVLSAAWDARIAGKNKDAVGLFLSALFLDTSASIRAELVLEICTILREEQHVKMACSLLDFADANGIDTALLWRIRRELVSS